MNCECFSDFSGGIVFPFKFNLSCAAFRVGYYDVGVRRDGVETRIRIAGAKGRCTNGRIMRVCIALPRARLRGRCGELTNFTGAELLGPKRARALAIRVPRGRLTSFGRRARA